MINVRAQCEYSTFDAQVRKPGHRFLATTPRPSSRDFQKHNYWRMAKQELHRAYTRCAYTSLRICESDASVDHFQPKSRYPRLAYEWSNYRLARPRLNSYKGDSESVVDPFCVRSGWFVLDFPTCLIRAGKRMPGKTIQQVQSTIEVLRLNSSDLLVQERCDWLVDFAEGRLPFSYVQKQYPFLAHEVTRQQIDKHQLWIYFKV